MNMDVGIGKVVEGRGHEVFLRQVYFLSLWM